MKIGSLKPRLAVYTTAVGNRGREVDRLKPPYWEGGSRKSRKKEKRKKIELIVQTKELLTSNAIFPSRVQKLSSS